jgi:hypothetical protein
MTLALTDPHHGSLGIAAGRRLRQLNQSIQKSRLCLGRRHATTVRPKHPPLKLPRTSAQIAQTVVNRAMRDPGCLPDRTTPPGSTACASPAANKQRRRSSNDSTRASNPASGRGGVDHTFRVAALSISSIQFPWLVPCAFAVLRIALFLGCYLG